MKVYKKKPNGRYEELGTEFRGFPSDGLWLVWDGRQNRIVKLDDMIGQMITGKMPEMIRVHKIIEDALGGKGRWSVTDKANEIVEKLFIKEK